jgi:hypothetical protein
VARNDLIIAITHDAEKCVVGLREATVRTENASPDDNEIDQASDLRLPFLKNAMETRVLQQDRGLYRRQFRDLDPSRRERALAPIRDGNSTPNPALIDCLDPAAAPKLALPRVPAHGLFWRWPASSRETRRKAFSKAGNDRTRCDLLADKAIQERGSD